MDGHGECSDPHVADADGVGGRGLGESRGAGAHLPHRRHRQIHPKSEGRRRVETRSEGRWCGCCFPPCFFSAVGAHLGEGGARQIEVLQTWHRALLEGLSQGGQAAVADRVAEDGEGGEALPHKRDRGGLVVHVPWRTRRRLTAAASGGAPRLRTESRPAEGLRVRPSIPSPVDMCACAYPHVRKRTWWRWRGWRGWRAPRTRRL